MGLEALLGGISVLGGAAASAAFIKLCSDKLEEFGGDLTELYKWIVGNQKELGVEVHDSEYPFTKTTEGTTKPTEFELGQSIFGSTPISIGIDGSINAGLKDKQGSYIAAVSRNQLDPETAKRESFVNVMGSLGYYVDENTYKNESVKRAIENLGTAGDSYFANVGGKIKQYISKEKFMGITQTLGREGVLNISFDNYGLLSPTQTSSNFFNIESVTGLNVYYMNGEDFLRNDGVPVINRTAPAELGAEAFKIVRLPGHNQVLALTEAQNVEVIYFGFGRGISGYQFGYDQNYVTHDGKRYLGFVLNVGSYTEDIWTLVQSSPFTLQSDYNFKTKEGMFDLSRIIFDGYQVSGSSLPGTAKQADVTPLSLPADDTTWDDTDKLLAKIDSVNGAMVRDAMTIDVLNADGTVTTKEYWGVAIPGSADVVIDGTDTTVPVSVSGSVAGTIADGLSIGVDATGAAAENVTKAISESIDIAANPNLPSGGSGITPPLVTPSGSAGALFTIYNPTNAEVNQFGGWLWSSDFVEQIKKVFSDPMQAIIGLQKIYVRPSISGRQNIRVGYLDSGVPADVVGSQYVDVDCGTVELSEVFGSVFDYDPYTSVSLYLPFVGIVSLNTSDIMRGKMSIVYHVDIISGACLAEVSIKREETGGVLYTYSGSCAVQYPISSGSYIGIVTGVLGVAGSIGAALATGGASLPASVVGGAGSILNSHTNVQRSGTFSGNAGAMGIKTPYLIISRPVTDLSDNFQHYTGIPSNSTVKVSECSGFTRFKEIHTENLNCYDSEIDEINTYLTGGVIC